MHFSAKLIEVLSALDLDVTIDSHYVKGYTVTMRRYGQVFLTASHPASSTTWELNCEDNISYPEDLDQGLLSLLTLH